MNYCLYHDHCVDGFAAATVVWMRYGDTGWKYIPVRYQEPVPIFNDADKILIVDFSYSKSILEELEKQCQALVVIDHHDTAPQDYHGIVFDKNRSGCVLTYEYLFGKSNLLNYVVPDWLLYIEDRDLWKWRLEYSREINYGIETLEKSFPVYSKIKMDEMYRTGKIIKDYKAKVIEGIIEHSWEENNIRYCQASGIFISDVGEALRNRYPEMLYSVIYNISNETLNISLRQGCSDIHLGELCKKYGGGGHRDAAGFKKQTKNLIRDLIGL